MKAAPHPIDVAVGARVRLRREELGLTQSHLASAIGLTFQQVQKYEKGTNRISASKLLQIATYLQTTGAALLGEGDAAGSAPVGTAETPDSAEMLRAFQAITSPEHRRGLITMARALRTANAG